MQEDGTGDRLRSEAHPHVVERGVEGTGAAAIERQRELDSTVVVEVGDGEPDQGQATFLDELRGCGEQRSDGRQDRRRLGGRLGQGVRSGGPGVVGEAQPQHDRAADPPALAQAPGHPVGEGDERGVDVLGGVRPAADGPLRSDRSAAPADLHGARIAVVRQGVQLTPGGGSEHGDQRPLAEDGDLADRRDAPIVELGGGLLPDTPQPLDG